jgi:deazaflavin-dependent oxidoreductase (nitroreductase family)
VIAGQAAERYTTSVADRRELSRRVIEEFRRNEGRVGGDFADVPLLLLTTMGARTGQRRTWPVTYLRDGARLVVSAANGGRPTHPGWYHNLLVNPQVTVEVGTETFEATASLVTGAQRQLLWDRLAAARPILARLQAGTDRLIPVIALHRRTT